MFVNLHSQARTSPTLVVTGASAQVAGVSGQTGWCCRGRVAGCVTHGVSRPVKFVCAKFAIVVPQLTASAHRALTRTIYSFDRKHLSCCKFSALPVLA